MKTKKELYQTARVARHVFTENGEHDLEAGQFVAVRFIRYAWNGLRHREEAVYGITTGGKSWGVAFESMFSDFCM